MWNTEQSSHPFIAQSTIRLFCGNEVTEARRTGDVYKSKALLGRCSNCWATARTGRYTAEQKSFVRAKQKIQLIAKGQEYVVSDE